MSSGRIEYIERLMDQLGELTETSIHRSNVTRLIRRSDLRRATIGIREPFARLDFFDDYRLDNQPATAREVRQPAQMHVPRP